MKPPPKITPRSVIKLDPKKSDLDKMSDVVTAFKGHRVKICGNALDLNNCEVRGSRFPKPDDSQDEIFAGIHVRIPGFTLKNGYVTGVPGGIICKGKGITFYDTQFRDIGEDDMSNQTDKTPGMRLLKCRFYNDAGGVKSLQLNDGNAAEIRDCHSIGGITRARVQEDSTKQRNKATVCNDTFEAAPIAGNVKVPATGNKYSRVPQKWVTDSGATHTGE